MAMAMETPLPFRELKPIAVKRALHESDGRGNKSLDLDIIDFLIKYSLNRDLPKASEE